MKNESINREGLGSQAINSDNISREEAESIIRDYARCSTSTSTTTSSTSTRSDGITDLVFASDLNFDERKEIRIMAKRSGLCCCLLSGFDFALKLFRPAAQV